MGKNKAPTYQGFMLSEMIVSNGIINGVINGIIFYFLNKNNTAITLEHFVIDLTVTMIILSLLLGALVPGLVKMKLKSGNILVPPFKKEDHLILRLFSYNSAACLILTMILASIIAVFFPLGIAFAFGWTKFSLIGGAVFKAFACGVCGASTFYFRGNMFMLKQASDAK